MIRRPLFFVARALMAPSRDLYFSDDSESGSAFAVRRRRMLRHSSATRLTSAATIASGMASVMIDRTNAAVTLMPSVTA